MRTQAMASNSVGIGASCTTILRTSLYTTGTAAAGTGVFTFYLKPGSAFDPTGDIASMQPQMFDQFAAMYNRYKVNSAHVRIRILGATGVSAASAVSWMAAAYPAVDSTAAASYQFASSQQFAKTTSGSFMTQQLGATVYGCGAEPKTLAFKLNHDQIVGSKTSAFDNGALVTADPTTLQYMVLPVFLQASGAGASVYNFEIDIFQNVTFSQKKNVADA